MLTPNNTLRFIPLSTGSKIFSEILLKDILPISFLI
jgi:hypothetical protein